MATPPLDRTAFADTDPRRRGSGPPIFSELTSYGQGKRSATPDDLACGVNHANWGRSGLGGGIAKTTRMTDAVEKTPAARGYAVGVRFRVGPGWASRLVWDPRPDCHATYAIDAHTRPVGGPSRRSAIVLRFCTMAAR